MNVLYVTSEAHPLIKTGGLGDVGGSLPVALQEEGHRVSLAMPGYRDVLRRAGPLRYVRSLDIVGHRVRLLHGSFAGSGVELWLVDAPTLYDRPGNPYLGPDGRPWPDNALRYGVFCRAVVSLIEEAPEGLRPPHVVHCNDWQTGLVPPLLHGAGHRPATLYTVHNLAYQGLFPRKYHRLLDLPDAMWHYSALEFHDQLSFLKGGLAYADLISTVSPTYAREIQTPEYGCGLDGLLRFRSDRLVGILNGIDMTIWNPATDRHLSAHYQAGSLAGKSLNRNQLTAECGWNDPVKDPVLGMVGRLVEQKGIDLVIDALPELIRRPLRLIILGSGEKRFEKALLQWAARHPSRVAVHIGFNERLAHLIEAGADIFLMPSRFEPCGLNQMYSLRYGTPPLVRTTGGLADTVVDATPDALQVGTATGVRFDTADSESLVKAVDRARTLFSDRELWRGMQDTGMKQDFSWGRSAREYGSLYTRLASAQNDSTPP